jgi:hypothetical protein
MRKTVSGYRIDVERVPPPRGNRNRSRSVSGTGGSQSRRPTALPLSRTAGDEDNTGSLAVEEDDMASGNGD